MARLALRSIQSEMSNVLSLLPVLLTKKTSTKESYLTLLMIIPFIIHVYRYYTNFKESYCISKKQKDFYILNLLDYLLIYLHAYNQNDTIMYGIISGCFSFYFIYIQYPVNPEALKLTPEAVRTDLVPRNTGIANPIMDIPMILFSLGILYNSSDPNLIFFAIRELTYHLIEIIIYY
jgi:hypothetical protein